MMTFSIIVFIVLQISVQLQAEEFEPHFPSQRVRSHEGETLDGPRFRSNHEHTPRDYSEYNKRITIKEYDLPVTFKAPRYEAHDYWKDDHNHHHYQHHQRQQHHQQQQEDYYNRRTFFEDSLRGRTTPFPGLYQFMSSVFGGGDGVPPEEGFHHNRVTPPYKSVTPFIFNPTEPNYIPPPKPIRASVIKLETITRSPIYSSFDFESTTKYYPQVGTILNHVLIESSKAQRNASWFPKDAKIPPFRPLPVLPKPAYAPPTTLRPLYPLFIANRTQNTFGYHNRTDYRYPESVQDQLPHLNLEDVQIPYEPEKPIPQIFVTPSTDAPRQTVDFFPSLGVRPTGNILDLIDVRGLSPEGTRRKERPSEFDPTVTTVKSFPGAVEKVKRPTFKYTKKLTAQLDRSPVERVTNLTVLGYSKLGNPENPVKEHSPVNYLNVRELISYEMKKLRNISQQTTQTPRERVNLNDELSLDAKILKDTNWDGLTNLPTTTETTTTTATTSTTTTTGSQRRKDSKPNTTAFWEIGPTTVSPMSTETETTTITEQARIQTTTSATDFIVWSSTPRTEETREFVTTEQATTRRKVSQEEPAAEEPDKLLASIEPIIKRKYSRRPKLIHFTPYPTPEESGKKISRISPRNHFPKRQKPNITLSFGNKDVIKRRESFANEEVMKFSDEDVRKRRKTGKRRQVYKRIRVSTSQSPSQNERL